MAYDVQSTSMLIGSISGDNIKIIFNPKQEKLYTGDSIKIIDEEKQGIVAQVYQIENLDFTSIADEALKAQIAHFNSITTSSYSDDMNSLHLASCKIKLSIISNKWVSWRGNLPSMSDYVDVVPPTEIISHTVGSSPLNPVDIGQFVSHYSVPLKFEASLLETTSLIVGDKSKEKSNLVNLIQRELTTKQAKVLIIDPKGSYNNLKGAKVLEAGKNFKLSLLDYGTATLGGLIAGQIEPNLKHRVENIYAQLTNRAMSMAKDFLPLNLLKDILEKELSTTEGQKYFPELTTLRNRIIAISKLGIFANTPDEIYDVGATFNNVNLVVLDISSVPLFWQKVFINNAIKDLTNYDGCSFIFYEDIYKYIDQETAIDLLYKSKNFGLNSIFMTNYESDIPLELIKQSENLFLFSTDTLENNTKFYNNLKADKTLLSMLLKRQPENNVLIYGDITNRYPILVELRDSNLGSLRNKHFGSIKKYISEYGEIIYSYKPIEGSTPAQQMPPGQQTIASQEHYHGMEVHEEPHEEDHETYDEFAGYSSFEIDQYAPTNIQQSSYMEKFQNITEEFEDELLASQASLDEDLQEFEMEDESASFQQDFQGHSSSHSSIAHQFPDEEFLPQHMQPQQPQRMPQQQQPQQRMPQQQHPQQQHHEAIAHQFPDEEFLPQHMQQPQQRMPQQQPPQQQRMPQQQPQQQHYQGGIAHHIPDEEFFPQQMQHPPQQQRMPQQQQPQQRIPQQQPQQPQQHYQETFSHQIPDEDFFPEHMQPQQQHYQGNIAHQIPDEDFFPEHIQPPPPQAPQQQRMPQQQPGQTPQGQQGGIAYHIPDDEFMPNQAPQKQAPQQHAYTQSFSQGQVRPESIPDHVEDIPVYASPTMGSDSIEFQEGDKVVHERYGVGTINRIITTGDKKLCSIQFQDFGRRLLDPKRGLTKAK